jgi:hypothetical protein
MQQNPAKMMPTHMTITEHHENNHAGHGARFPDDFGQAHAA